MAMECCRCSAAAGTAGSSTGTTSSGLPAQFAAEEPLQATDQEGTSLFSSVLPSLGTAASQDPATAAATAGDGFIRLFVGVLTSGANAEARAAVRGSWGRNPNLHRVLFFAAKPREPEVFEELRKEAATEGDIVMLPNVWEGYHNITHQTLEVCRVSALHPLATHTMKVSVSDWPDVALGAIWSWPSSLGADDGESTHSLDLCCNGVTTMQALWPFSMIGKNHFFTKCRLPELPAANPHLHTLGLLLLYQHTPNVSCSVQSVSAGPLDHEIMMIIQTAATASKSSMVTWTATRCPLHRECFWDA